MKLKQRAIVTGSLFLGLFALLLVGLLLGHKPDDSENAPVRNKPRVKLPDIPGVLPDERVNNPNNNDRQAVADGLIAIHNRSRDLSKVLHRRDKLELNDMFEQAKDRNRRLQQKLESNSTESVDKHPRQPDLLKAMAQQDADVHAAKDTQPSQKDDDRPHEVMETQASPENGKRDPWKIWHSWVKQDEFYPRDAFWSEEMNTILRAMGTYPITSFGVGHKGTQLKVSMFLDKQRTAFKPMRYPRSKVIEGDPYAGFDRHNAEIAGFHLDGLLGFRIAPPVVGRRVNLTALWPITSQPLRNTYFKDDGGNTCFYGKCYYCRKEEAACAEKEVMEGSMTLWLPDWYEMKVRRHPYQRTYRPNRKAKWEKDDSYCDSNIITNPGSDYYHGLLEITDSSIFDFLMGNADRHHYETYAKAKKHGKMLHIDNGKSFGNPHHDEMSILAPLHQCCRVRRSTWEKIEELLTSDTSLSRKLDQSLRRDPVYPVLTSLHLEAIDRRLEIIDKVVRQCFSRHGRDTVLVTQWPPNR